MKKSIICNIVILFLVACIYIGLPLAILFGYIDFHLKFHVLTIGGIFVYIVSRLIGFSNKELGISNNAIILSMKSVLPVTCLLALIGIVLYFVGYSRITPNEKPLFFAFYIFISSPMQEFLYRGALVSYCEKLKVNKFLGAIITSLLYSFVHIIYKDVLTMILTFLIGVVWYICYRKSNNLIGVSISHAVLGVVTIVGGVIN